MCDLAVASSTARFAVSGVNVGLFCSHHPAWRFHEMFYASRRSKCSSPENSSVAGAKARGLINRVAEPEHSTAELEKLVAAIISKPRVAVAIGKEFFTVRSKWVSQPRRRGESNHGMNMMDESKRLKASSIHRKRPPRWNKEMTHRIGESRLVALTLRCDARGVPTRRDPPYLNGYNR